MRRAIPLGWVLLALTQAAAACGRPSTARPQPQPTLATSREAQAAFRGIMHRWLAGGKAERAALEGPVRAFLHTHGDDDLARLARVYLAWILMQKRRLVAAQAMVAEARAGPAGNAQDAATVASAAILIRLGRSDEALALLAPLRGKMIDATERVVYGEQLVHAALGGRHWRRAIEFMLDWLAQAPPNSRDAVQAAVQHQLPRIPTRALERTLVSLDQAAADSAETSPVAPARSWLAKTIRARLSELALNERDAALAARLIESGPAALRRGKEGARLIRLAARGSVVPRIVGRSIGLVISVGTLGSRQRSAEVAMGMSRALGLPAAAADSASVRLVTRHDQPSDPRKSGMHEALAGLAGDGATILVAGVDSAGAMAAARFADRTAIPVIVLQPLPRSPASRFAFVLGVDLDEANQVLAEALRSAGAATVARVGPQGVACGADAPAGHPRFPIAEWKRTRVGALLLGGDSACAREAVAEATHHGLRLRIGLGLRCSELYPALTTRLPVMAVAAGRFPVSADGTPSEPTRRWTESVGSSPGWYHALGNDAALLAAAALVGFPLGRVDDAREVARLHRQAQVKLASAEASLWSSSRLGFAGSRRLERDIRVVGADDTDFRKP